jgi:hypothetical protein
MSKYNSLLTVVAELLFFNTGICAIKPLPLTVVVHCNIVICYENIAR